MEGLEGMVLERGRFEREGFQGLWEPFTFHCDNCSCIVELRESGTLSRFFTNKDLSWIFFHEHRSYDGLGRARSAQFWAFNSFIIMVRAAQLILHVLTCFYYAYRRNEIVGARFLNGATQWRPFLSGFLQITVVDEAPTLGGCIAYNYALKTKAVSWVHILKCWLFHAYTSFSNTCTPCLEKMYFFFIWL